MRALRTSFALASVAALAGCATPSAIAVKNDGTVYVVRGDKVYACSPAGEKGLDCPATPAATLK